MTVDTHSLRDLKSKQVKLSNVTNTITVISIQKINLNIVYL